MPKHEQRSVLQASTSVESHEILDNAPSTPIRAATPQRRSGGRDATLWMLLGLASIVMGVALAATPVMSWSAGRIATRLGEMGVHSDVLVVGGVLMMVLALVRRGQESARAEMQYDSSLLFEQIATELVEIRSAVDSISNHSDALQQQLLDMGKSLEDSRTALAGEIERHAPRDNSDALFQLASGLDKLGLRFEQRLRLHHSTLQESVDELAATVEHTRRSLEERIESQGLHAIGRVDADAPIEHLEPTTEPEPQAYETTSYEVAIADTPVAGESNVETGEEQRSLGLLDQFEDTAPPPALPHAIPHAHSSHGVEEFGVGDAAHELDQAARSARSGSWDEELMVEHPADDDMQAKLQQLESLLADDRLRAALDSMRRQA